MTGPRRLFDDTTDPLVREMLQAARDDVPSSSSMQKTLAALGVAGAATLVPTSVAAGTAGGAGAASGAGAATAGAGSAGSATAAAAAAKGGAIAGASVLGTKTVAAGGMALAAKWATVGVAGGLLTLGVASQFRDEAPAEPPAAAVVAPAHVAPAVAPRPGLAERELGLDSAKDAVSEETAESVEPKTEPSKPASAPAPAPVAPPEAPVARRHASAASNAPAPRAASEETAPVLVPPSPLEREVALVDIARSAVARGDGNTALRSLAQYRTEFPKGRLLPEAEYLTMRAKMAQGDQAGARAAAEHLLRRYPTGPHAPRAKALLEQTASASDRP